ncbi:RCC1/BLIP-II [Testicularia cyperi]|uniref:RCC1/BLIP-II n=1 Tax=Testicularia cyperi TaxID=1882483 RepID=A0A317XHB4_9BASI|nr:RCC1/BLIP-II [Testicularia cyperi]
MSDRLLVAGSNSGFQLGLGHDRDAHQLEQALCIDPSTGVTQVLPFPPAGWDVVRISSGSNHTLALLEQVGAADKQRVLWATGTGEQGQLGAEHARSAQPLHVFRPLSLRSVFAHAQDGTALGMNLDHLEVKDIACGWNCSYLILRTRQRPDRLSASTVASSSSSPKDVLVSLGRFADNTFGELGVMQLSDTSQANRCAHVVSFAQALQQQGFGSDSLYTITSVAAGLRHAIAELRIGPCADGSCTSMIVGWGAARHGQVGAVPKPIASGMPRTMSRRPGPVPVLALVPQVMNLTPIPARSPTCKSSTLAAGRDHSVVLSWSGSGESQVTAFGSNRQDQLPPCGDLSADSDGEAHLVIESMSCNWNSTLALGAYRCCGGTVVWGCGSNAKGQLGSGRSSTATSGSKSFEQMDLSPIDPHTSPLRAGPHGTSAASSIRVRKLVSGSEHSLLLVDRQTGQERQEEVAEVWGCGWNEHGNLAQGPHDETDRYVPVPIVTGSRTDKEASNRQQQPQPRPVNIWAGFGTSFILTQNVMPHEPAK